MSLTIKRTDHGDVTVLELSGIINLGDGSRTFRKTVTDLLKSGRLKLVVVYEGVQYVDSSGNGEIVTAYTMARNAGGEMVLAGLPKSIMELMEISKLLNVFNVFHSVPEALSYFAKEPADGTSRS